MELCERYSANERGAWQREIGQRDEELAASRKRISDLERQLGQATMKVAEKEEEIEKMSRQLASATLRKQGYLPAATQQYPHGQAQPGASGRPAAPTGPAAGAGILLQGQPLNVSAQPFHPGHAAGPVASHQQQQSQQQATQRALLAIGAPPQRKQIMQADPAVAGPSKPRNTPHRLGPKDPSNRDDVFDPSNPSPMDWRPVDFGKQPLPKLFDEAFQELKFMVIQMGYKHIPRSGLPGEKKFIDLCIEHVGKPKMTFIMLNDTARYTLLVTGLLHRMLIDEIFKKPALLSFPNDQDGHVETLRQRYQVEQDNLQLDDFSRRLTIAEMRADAAKAIQRLPGFWKWIQEKAQLVMEEIWPSVSIFASLNHGHARTMLARTANELLRLHVRMLQDPATYSFDFAQLGTPWHSDRMINRDPMLIGQFLSNERSPWVTQCTITPLIMEERWERTPGSDRVFHRKEVVVKGEMTLCPRAGNLRQ